MCLAKILIESQKYERQNGHNKKSTIKVDSIFVPNGQNLVKADKYLPIDLATMAVNDKLELAGTVTHCALDSSIITEKSI